MVWASGRTLQCEHRERAPTETWACCRFEGLWPGFCHSENYNPTPSSAALLFHQLPKGSSRFSLSPVPLPSNHPAAGTVLMPPSPEDSVPSLREPPRCLLLSKPPRPHRALTLQPGLSLGETPQALVCTPQLSQPPLSSTHCPGRSSLCAGLS